MNKIDEQAREGKFCLGMWIASDSSAIAELLGHLGFDWILLDLEHGIGGESALWQQLQAIRSTPTDAIVRVVTNDPGQIKRALDMGASGIMVPFVNTADDARRAVNAMQYPPSGCRGVAGLSGANRFGLDFKDYFANANQILKVMQIETAQGVSNVEQIAKVDGVDVIFVGPLDLSVNLGIPAEYDHPRLKESIKHVVQACKNNGKIAGMFLPSPGLVADAVAEGFTFVAFGTEMDILRDTVNTIVGELSPYRQ